MNVRYPLVLPTASFAGGIAVAEHFSVPMVLAWCLALLALVGQAIAASHGGRQSRGVAAAVQTGAATFVALGLVAHRLAETTHPPSDLRHQTSTQPTLGALRGQILETPTHLSTTRRGKPVVSTVLQLKVTAWRTGRSDWEPAHGLVRVQLRGSLPADAWRGRILEATGIIEPPPTREGPGMFDFAAHLRRLDVHRTLRVERPEDCKLWPATSPQPWSARFLPWAHFTLAQGVPDDESSRLLRAMALGWKTPLSDQVADVFMQAGTMHVFAISGLHIAMLVAMVMQLLRAIRVPRLAAGSMALLLAWGYVIATGWQPSSVRSALMASVVMMGEALERPANLLNSLAGAGAIVLFLEPGQLFQSGFQLSFGVVAGLAVLTQPIEQRFLGWIRIDDWVPDSLRPRWQTWLAKLLRILAMDLAVGITAFLTSLPLTVHHFNLISPVSLAANLLVIPLSSLALAATTASLAIAPLYPGGSELFNASGWLWMHWMIDLSRWFANWPGGWWYVAAPPWWWWCGWYVALGLACRCETRNCGGRFCQPLKPRWIRCVAGGLVVWVLLAVATWWWRRQIPRLFIFRNEPGLLVQTPEGTTLFDGGRAGAGQRLILPLLRAQGVNHLGDHFVSQGLQRFCGSGLELLPELPPSRVWVPPLNPSRQPVLRQYVAALKQRVIPIQTIRPNLDVAGWIPLTFPDLAAVPRSGRAMDFAPVLAREFAGVQVLWLGGAGHPVQKQLLGNPRATQADVVLATAVSGMDPLLPELARQLHPQLLIITTAPFPAAAQVAPAARDRLKAYSFPVLFTDDTGGILLEFQSGRVRWQGFGNGRVHPARQRSEALQPFQRESPMDEREIDAPPAGQNE